MHCKKPAAAEGDADCSLRQRVGNSAPMPERRRRRRLGGGASESVCCCVCWRMRRVLMYGVDV